MTYDELLDKIKGNAYNSLLPYPSFATNERKTGEQKEATKHMRTAYREDESRLEGIFREDLRTYIGEQIGKPLSNEQWNAIFNKAWDDGHSSGYQEVLQCADELVTIIKTFTTEGK